jgi:hypothetical protein
MNAHLQASALLVDQYSRFQIVCTSIKKLSLSDCRFLKMLAGSGSSVRPPSVTFSILRPFIDHAKAFSAPWLH